MSDPPLSRRESVLLAITEVLANEPDALRLALALSQKIAHFIHARRAFVGLMTDGVIAVEKVIVDGEAQSLVRRFGAKDEAVGWVMTYKRPYQSKDPAHDARLSSAYVETFECKSLLTLPILNFQNHLLGVIEVQDRCDGEHFDQTDIDLLQLIALQSAPALERAHLFSKMGGWANAVSNLLAFNASLNRQLDPRKLIHRLVEHAAQFIGAVGGLAGLMDGTLLTASGYLHHRRWLPFQGAWHSEEGLPGWVYFNECSFLTNHYSREVQADPHFIDQFGVVSALCVPIMDAREHVLGFFELHNKAEGREPFTWSDAQFMESLANTAAVAIHNSLLLQELERHQADLRALSARNATILEDERRRIARELHDETGQALIGVKLNLQVLTRKIPAEMADLRQEADRLRQQINISATQIKGIAQNLRPPTLDELGLQVALSQLIQDFEKRTGIAAHLSTAVGESADKPTQRLPAAIETPLYRITQEALTNIARHANANQVCISIEQNHTEICLVIGDNGQGFDTRQIPNQGLGLLGMKERTLMLGGKLDVQSEVGRGTIVRVTIPT
ncbi:MAG: GAF domain-containing sensor histidine kinase [Caldilineaceae bacterium]